MITFLFPLLEIERGLDICLNVMNTKPPTDYVWVTVMFACGSTGPWKQVTANMELLSWIQRDWWSWADLPGSKTKHWKLQPSAEDHEVPNVWVAVSVCSFHQICFAANRWPTPRTLCQFQSAQEILIVNFHWKTVYVTTSCLSTLYFC